MAASKILIRDISQELKTWIGSECDQHKVTQQEFLLRVLNGAYTESAQPSLFNNADKPLTIPASGGMPFAFIDLFAGIGGLRLGVEAVGGHCVFSSEWDANCQKTYKAWFGEVPHGDITKVEPKDIPDHDVLVGGFPCQPFSIAGVSKKNALGLPHGFKDATQGNLFFNVATIIQNKRPPAFILENVKNLMSHDKGRTWQVIKGTLEDLKYKLFTKVIDAGSYVPQHRERIFIVGFDKHVFGETPPFEFPKAPEGSPKFKSIMEPRPDSKYVLSDHLWKYLQDYAKRHKEKGNGFGFGLVDLNGVSRTLSARYYKDGSEILIPRRSGNPRRLTPREAAKLMGFPDHLPIVVSDTQAYRQFGNAVVPLVAEAVARQVVKVMEWHLLKSRGGCLLKTASPTESDKKPIRHEERRHVLAGV